MTILLCEIGLKLILIIFTPFFNLKLLLILIILLIFLFPDKGSLYTSPFKTLLFIFKSFIYLYLLPLLELCKAILKFPFLLKLKLLPKIGLLVSLLIDLLLPNKIKGLLLLVLNIGV